MSDLDKFEVGRILGRLEVLVWVSFLFPLGLVAGLVAALLVVRQ